MGGHCTDPIFKHKKVLNSGFIPDHMPNRMDEIKAISKLVYDYLDGNQSNILISGPAGTGKTAAIRYIFREFKYSIE